MPTTEAVMKPTDPLQKKIYTKCLVGSRKQT